MEAREDVLRQLNHWLFASQRLKMLDEIASPEAWKRMEDYTGKSLRQVLAISVQSLCQQGNQYKEELLQQVNPDLNFFRSRVRQLRERYLRTESTLDFYGDAINSRSSDYLASILTSCDILARLSMHKILVPLGQASPPVLTYIDKGLGASILKAGLRLWDQQTISPVAAIKVVRHNLFRPTSLIHEAGHQIAHIIGWNQQLADHLRNVLMPYDKNVAMVWGSWASEIAADAVAFVYTGYASVAALHDVLAGSSAFVFNFAPGDPHPISFLRVLLGIHMCRLVYRKGPWDQMEENWLSAYPLSYLGEDLSRLIERSVKLMPQITQAVLYGELACFGKKALIHLINPQTVSYSNLKEKYGNMLQDSSEQQPSFLLENALPLLGYYGYLIATDNPGGLQHIKAQENFMLNLGNTILQKQKITLP